MLNDKSAKKNQQKSKVERQTDRILKVSANATDRPRGLRELGKGS